MSCLRYLELVMDDRVSEDRLSLSTSTYVVFSNGREFVEQSVKTLHSPHFDDLLR